MHISEVARIWEENAWTWTHLSRGGRDVYRDALNTPEFLDSLPPVAGLDGLDIGCGEGANTRAVARCGARMWAIDIAPSFVRHAHEAEREEPLGIAYRLGDGAALPFDDGSFDFATAFMSLMDMPDQAGAMREAARVLKPGGFFQFSITHPCFVPPVRRNVRDSSGRVHAVELADYFEEGTGEDRWWFPALTQDERRRLPPFRVPRFHRTLSGWFAIIRDAGFTLEALCEPRASEELARAEPIVADTRVAPLFLHVRCRKGG